MSDRKIQDELEGGLPAPVYLFHGMPFLVEEVGRKIQKRFFPDEPDDFNCHLFHAAEADPEEIVTTAGTLPFMAERRLVMVKEAGALKAAAKNTFENYLKDPSPMTCLVFLTGTLDKRNAFLKLLGASGCKSFQVSVPENQVPMWLRSRAADSGIKLSAEAERHLLDLVGPDLAILSAELEKLALSGSREISVEQVEESVGHVREYTPFAIVEAIRRGNIERALRIMKALRESGQDAVSLLGIIGWHYRQMYRRESKKKGFKDIFEALHNADVELKTSGKPEAVVLEMLLFRLMRKRQPH